MGLMLSSVGAMLARMRTARDVELGTYFLRPGRVTEALLEAAKRGAHVRVAAQHDPYGGDAADARPQANDAIARELRAAGAEVTLFERDATPFHLKAAVCDGEAFLDDRNWTGSGKDLVLADDDRRDVQLVGEALRGTAGADAALALRKDEALRREAALIEGAPHDPVLVETETIGRGPLSHALREHAAAGAATTLIVAPAPARKRSEAETIRELRAHGVRVLTGGSDEKMALAGDAAWIGSANGTSTYYTGKDGRPRPAGDQIEWGLVTREPRLVDAVRAALARDAAA